MQGARREHPRFGAVTDEQRRSRPGPAPEGWGDFAFWLRFSSERVRKFRGVLFSRQRPDGEAQRRRISSLDLRLRSNEARRPLARKPSGRRVFCPWPALARSLQPALGMLRPRRLGHSQNPSPQDPAQFSDTLSVAEPWLCSFVVPRQKAKSPPAKPEVIFAQTLRPSDSNRMGSARAPRAVVGALADYFFSRKKRSPEGFIDASDRRGAGRNTRGRVCSPSKTQRFDGRRVDPFHFRQTGINPPLRTEILLGPRDGRQSS